ncbi:MAG: type II secretion system protein [Lentisphaeria bacterium]|nr:type II secretion system protein [Lentisphaeria bacterium]
MKNRHFTVIELVIVITVIAVLASMLLPALRRIRAGSLETRCLARKKQFLSAQTLYRNDYGCMVNMVPIGKGHFLTFSQLLVSGPRNYNLGYLAPQQLLCTANPHSDNLANAYDAPVGMPHFSKAKTEVKQFIANGAGDCFISAEEQPVGVFFPEKCKTPSALFIVADATFADRSNKVPGMGGSFGIYCAVKNPPKAVHLAHGGRTTLGFPDGRAAAYRAEELAGTVNRPKVCIEADGLTVRNLE